MKTAPKKMDWQLNAATVRAATQNGTTKRIGNRLSGERRRTGIHRTGGKLGIEQQKHIASGFAKELWNTSADVVSVAPVGG
jgi:hypothetical protein